MYKVGMQLLLKSWRMGIVTGKIIAKDKNYLLVRLNNLHKTEIKYVIHIQRMRKIKIVEFHA